MSENILRNSFEKTVEKEILLIYNINNCIDVIMILMILPLYFNIVNRLYFNY